MALSSWRSGLVPFLTPAAALACWLCGAATLPAGQPAAPAKKYALLVGCTEYKNYPQLEQLYGPRNDVPLFAGVLTKRFGFDPANVKILVGWPADGSKRPTYKNIAAAFENLVATAAPGTEIVILLSGHGTQIPIPEGQDPLDPKNYEPDGLDEVFLPADVKEGGPRDLQNIIIDDQVGAWLGKMRERGAAVWILFDCCHSGDMMRGDGRNEVERQRWLPPEALGVPRAKVDAAIQRAAAAVVKAEKSGKGERSRGATLEKGAVDLPPAGSGPGSVVAFYAAQSFEKAPELPRPPDAPRTPEHYYGLLTYTVTKALQERKSAMSYRDLTRVLVAGYRAERGSRAPTPYAEGDLDQEVLGLKRWPAQDDIVLHKEGEALKLSQGALRGLTPGTVLAVHPPGGDARDPKSVLGHVRVVSVTPTDAAIEPAAAEGGPAVRAAQLPDLGRCRVVSRDLGDLRVKLTVGRPAVGQETRQANLAAALKLLGKDVQELVAVVPDEAAAEWVLQVVTPAQAQTAGLADLPRPMALLMEGGGRRSASGSKTSDPSPEARLTPRRVAASYPAEDPAQLAGQLERDLQRIFTWQNVWRIAGTVGNGADGGGTAHGLKFQVLKLKGQAVAGELPDGEPVLPGQRIRCRLENTGPLDLWVTILFLDGTFAIQVVGPQVLPAGVKRDLMQGTIEGDSTGTEGFVVLALPTEVSPGRPNFSFLAQERVGRGGREGTRGARAEQAPPTPFGRLLKAAAVGGGTRSFHEEVPTNPAVLSWSWLTVSPRTAKAPRRP